MGYICIRRNYSPQYVIDVDGFISRTQSGTTGYLFHDAHGDIKAAYSSSKTKLADYTYDAWGNQTAANNSAWSQANPIRYNGQYYGAESSMTYLRARYYDSNIQRFTTEDPIKDGLNWYSYANNNPVMFVDPTGTLAEDGSDEKIVGEKSESDAVYGELSATEKVIFSSNAVAGAAVGIASKEAQAFLDSNYEYQADSSTASAVKHAI